VSLSIVVANQAAAEQYGYTTGELETLSLTDIRPPDVDAESIRAVNRALPPGRKHTGIWKHRRKDGTLLDVDVHLNEVNLGGRTLRLAVLHDVSQRCRLEEQLREAQKMEAVGRLARGLAHDFNNLLTTILGYCDVVAARFKDGDPARAEISEIRHAGERAAGLTRQLLAFSRKQVLVPEALDLGALVRRLAPALRRLVGEGIVVRVVVAPELGRVLADPGQIEQVVMNLADNARDAMPRGGELSLELGSVDLDLGFVQEHLGATRGPHVLLTVTDTGVGMEPDVLKNVFDPFYTTKKLCEAPGLGLSTVHGIVNQSGGTIVVDSTPGRGTTFRIYLPRVAQGADPPAISPVVTVPPPRLTGTILLVDDDDQLRRLGRIVLERGGYAVLDACDGAGALRVARGHLGPIDLLLTDVVMPSMSGPQLAQALQRERPDVPILFMSGYTDIGIQQHGVLSPGTQFLPKPYTPLGLLERVRMTLRGGPP